MAGSWLKGQQQTTWQYKILVQRYTHQPEAVLCDVVPAAFAQRLSTCSAAYLVLDSLWDCRACFPPLLAATEQHDPNALRGMAGQH